MTLADFLGCLSEASLRGYEFQLCDSPIRLQLLSGFGDELVCRKVITHVRSERRGLDPIETVCLLLMLKKLIAEAPVFHPLVAAQHIGLERQLADDIIRASTQGYGYRRKLRARLLLVCNLPQD